MSWTQSESYPVDLTTPAQARSFSVTQLHARLGCSDEAQEVIDATELIVSELITNALEAGCHRCHLELRMNGSLVITVCDDAPGLPVARRPAASEPHGRGLTLVAGLSSRWGTRPTENGKEVWAELSLVATA